MLNDGEPSFLQNGLGSDGEMLNDGEAMNFNAVDGEMRVDGELDGEVPNTLIEADGEMMLDGEDPTTFNAVDGESTDVEAMNFNAVDGEMRVDGELDGEVPNTLI